MTQGRALTTPHAPSYNLAHSHTTSHTLTQPRTPSHILTTPHTPSHSLAQPHANSHTLTHPRTPSHTLTHPRADISGGKRRSGGGGVDLPEGCLGLISKEVSINCFRAMKITTRFAHQSNSETFV